VNQVSVFVTGKCEEAIGDALHALFPDLAVTVQPRRDGFTSAALGESPILDPRSNLRKLAAALVAEVEPGRRSKPPDMVIAIDDLELVNFDHPERPYLHFREAVRAHASEHPWPTALSRTRAEDRLRERCSFHLLVPMVEAYFFADPDALARCGASSEALVEDDPERLRRHAKEALRELNPDYLETRECRSALSSLGWSRVLATRDHARHLRALAFDVAERFGVSLPPELDGERFVDPARRPSAAQPLTRGRPACRDTQ
jgi:hypothetical protein